MTLRSIKLYWADGPNNIDPNPGRSDGLQPAITCQFALQFCLPKLLGLGVRE